MRRDCVPRRRRAKYVPDRARERHPARDAPDAPRAPTRKISPRVPRGALKRMRRPLRPRARREAVRAASPPSPPRVRSRSDDSVARATSSSQNGMSFHCLRPYIRVWSLKNGDSRFVDCE